MQYLRPNNSNPLENTATSDEFGVDPDRSMYYPGHLRSNVMQMVDHCEQSEPVNIYDVMGCLPGYAHRLREL